ncbi:MAG TPA: DUF3798 domain-containing protein [Firmicutes bacterium]|nr:DUF3798 domain-containing protein [Bacillota bacterium]
MRKFWAWVLVLALLVTGLVGCAPQAESEDPAGEPGEEEFKIGLVTGTVSQGEDEYRAAEKMVAKYGDMITHVTYPDNFMQEQETTIAQITGLADDPAIKAIVICQAVPGSIAALQRVKEKRPDMIFVFGTPHEDPDMVSEYPDIAFDPDQLARGETIVKLAKEMGATHFLHYSFPRHMAMPLLAQRKDIMEQTCKEEGLEFVFATAPDPMSDVGVTGAQQAVLEDVPRQVKEYGKNIAVFSTNCAMQEPLIKASLDSGCLFPEQCCPSPTHGYPGALGIEISPEQAGNMDEIVKAINDTVIEKGGAGRFGTWPVSVNMLFVEGGVELAKDAIEGKIDLKDTVAVQKKLEEISGTTITLNKYKEDGNFLMLVAGSIIFGEGDLAK